MKLHILLLPLALAACTSGKPTANAAADATAPATTPQAAAASTPVNDATLARYHWQLTDATDADGARIDALLVRDDKPVQLDFIENRLSISNTCNLMNGEYHLADGHLKIEQMAQTELACADAGVAALDSAVSNRLEGKTGIELTGSEDAPRLILTTQAGDKLVFSGNPTAATRYGNQGEQVFMEVAAETAPCSQPLGPDQQCLQVRERTYADNGVITSDKSAAWKPLDQDIEGYTHESGVRNVLRLKRYTVENPPADGPSVAYVLDMVVESEQTKP